MTMFSAEETLISASTVHHRRGGLVEGGGGGGVTVKNTHRPNAKPVSRFGLAVRH